MCVIAKHLELLISSVLRGCQLNQIEAAVHSVAQTTHMHRLVSSKGLSALIISKQLFIQLRRHMHRGEEWM